MSSVKSIADDFMTATEIAKYWNGEILVKDEKGKRIETTMPKPRSNNKWRASDISELFGYILVFAPT